MREIEFRGISIKTDKWVYGFLYYNAAECCLQIVEFVQHPPSYSEPGGDQHNIFHNIKSGTESQFTGLLDKNGVEIYEGDIVEYEDRKWEVVFDYDRWDMKNGEMFIRYDDLADDPGFTTWEFSEVIGNIYQNKNLL